MENNTLIATAILDYTHPSIEALVQERGWENLDVYEKIGAAYNFVKDEVRFGYNASDDIPASQVLRDGYGQCNTKGTLLMALLRRLGIPCRFHGFTIDNQLQKGAIPPYLFALAPQYIIHSWVEVEYQGQWLNLEGFILDNDYLCSIQQRFKKQSTNFCGYGVATPDLLQPSVRWQGESTYIQKEGIHDDFGVYDAPDDFYAEKGTNLTGIKRLLYRWLLRHLINWNVHRLRTREPKGAASRSPIRG